MTSPYINTTLTTQIQIRPDQMDNRLYLNLKENLSRKLVGKCYKDNGCIVELYKILDYSTPHLIAEDFTSSARTSVMFSCKICKPLEKQEITCRVVAVTKIFLTAENGPIRVIITPDRINETNFFKDNTNNLRFRNESGSQLIKSGDFVKVLISNIEYIHGDKRIKVIGVLNSVASDNDIERFYEDLHSKLDEPVEQTEQTETKTEAEAPVSEVEAEQD